MIHIWWWLKHVTGVDNPTGQPYAFWSGFAGDLFIFGGFVTLYKKHNCHYSGCWRVGKHIYEGTPYCTKHFRTKEK